VYNVIIPLILDDEALPELAMEDWNDESRRGTLKYQIGTASMMGDDAMHGTQACDYREKKGMRMAATVYIADIQLMNYEQITKGTLTQIFPLPDEDWLWAQRGRHWGGGNSLKTDKGREKFSVSDHRSDCYERAEQDMCESDVHGTRKKCLKSCKVYEGDNSGDKDWYVESFDPEIQYEEWYYLTQFFNMAWDYKCVDSSDQCEEGAERGLCLTDPDRMKELGCHRSCLFCFSSDSVDLYSLGETQLFESDDDDAHEKETPSHMDVLEIIVKTEQYLANKVFVAPDHEHVRLACRNYDEKCAIWAAQGFCEDDRGFMGKHCPAACQDCLMVDYKMRCPFDEEEANIFGPGELNNMFERILEECGEDPSTFSPENLPSGGTHPFGEVKVISSPYDNMIEYLSDEDIPKIDQFSPVPWMLLMEGFLSEEECDKLIELGKINGYERSTIDGDSDVGGEVAYAESEDRTSENSFCGHGCKEDPIVKSVLERMEAITGIPYTNYEDLQLVRYEVGQFYSQHHDYSESMAGTVPGHRILTFFMYLNDVEDGGGTKFEDLNFIAKPKRGSALIWPSVTDANLDQIEEWTYHEALPVTKGIKYGANAWVSTN
jgi:prolyl 4-hydroxylase